MYHNCITIVSHTIVYMHMNWNEDNNLLHLKPGMIFAICNHWKARQLLGSTEVDAKFITISALSVNFDSRKNCCTFLPSGLGGLHNVCQSIADAKHDNPGKHIVVCSGRDVEMMTRCALLLGGYFILCESFTVSDVTDMFLPLSTSFIPFKPWKKSTDSITVQDFWKALFNSRQLGWLDFTKSNVDVDRCIDMQEYLHYDCAANGSLHVLIPGKLLVIACPSDLDGGATWSDTCGARRFSAAYYPDIFADFGVQLVVRCGGRPYNTRVLEAHGIGIEDLPIEASSESSSSGDSDSDSDSDSDPDSDSDSDSDSAPDRAYSSSCALRAADRFLTLARLVPGAIALHGGGPAGSLGAGGRLLAETLLIHQHGFDGPAALAWILMIHPGPSARAAAVVAVEEPTVTVTARCNAARAVADGSAAEGGGTPTAGGGGRRRKLVRHHSMSAIEVGWRREYEAGGLGSPHPAQRLKSA